MSFSRLITPPQLAADVGTECSVRTVTGHDWRRGVDSRGLEN